MPTLKVKNNGVWEKVAGGGGSSESNTLVVTISTATKLASHSASEIVAAVKSGKSVCAVCLEDNIVLNQYNPESNENSVEFYSVNVTNGNINTTIAVIANDKTVLYEAEGVVGVPPLYFSNIMAGQVLTVGENKKPVWADAPNCIPSGGTVGQVLTIGDDGKPVWTYASNGGGDLPAAEEVEF